MFHNTSYVCICLTVKINFAGISSQTTNYFFLDHGLHCRMRYEHVPSPKIKIFKISYPFLCPELEDAATDLDNVTDLIGLY